MSLDIKKIDLLIQYIASVAGQEEWPNRELGDIHIIKYLYLADLAYAPRHEGRTFTGLNWIFYKFGPWAEEAYQRVEPALHAIGAEKRVYPSRKFEKDCVRWSFHSDRELERLEREIPVDLMGVIQRNVHEFGSNTSDLLNHVYQTEPMLRAAPGENLDLLPAVHESISEFEAEFSAHLTKRQIKKRKENLSDLKRRLREKLEAKKNRKRLIPTPPRYDEVFFQGLECLDTLAGDPIETMDGTLTISEDIWKSKARYDPDVS